MKLSVVIIALAFIVSFALPSGSHQPVETFELVFSTYFGGSDWEHARDVCTAPDGSIVVVGGTSSKDFPTTKGAFDRSFNDGGKDIGRAGSCDIFVTKFDPEGKLLWSTFVGGPNYDRAYAVKVDAQGFVYIAGRAGVGFPVTDGVFQKDFLGSRKGAHYGRQNGFVAKLSADGAKLIWASYVGVSELCRDMDIDDTGSVYLPLGWGKQSSQSPRPTWFKSAFGNAFQKQPQGGTDCGVVKIKSDGSQVLWATWIGGSGKETVEGSIRVDTNKQVYIACNTRSKDMPTTKGVCGEKHFGGEDGYVALLKADGSDLIYGTYVGGSGTEWLLNTHCLAIDSAGNAYISTFTGSADFPTTKGALSRTLSGDSDMAVVKLSPRGALLRGTFVGGSGVENPDGIWVDKNGSVLVSGETNSWNFPVVGSVFQKRWGGGNDAVLLRLSPDFARLTYSQYFGGGGYDNGRACYLGPQGDLYLTGATTSRNWPTKNAFQKKFAGGKGRYGNGDCVLLRLRPKKPQ